MTSFADLREEALAATLALSTHGLVTLTWGNASVVDHAQGAIAIKPSGIAYEMLTAADMVVLALDGRAIEGHLAPSTDTPTHIALYRAFPEIGAVVHTHSTWATAWCQAQREIPLYGTTHADLCACPIPLTRSLTAEEVNSGYELHTGTALIEEISQWGPDRLPCALVRGHAPFAWGRTAAAAVQNAVTLEEVARMALLTEALAPDAPPLDPALRDKHHDRKHGAGAYYGQR